eukprot:COSAG03_NODE_3629_length_1912_cov_2.605074_1_plen_228_part_10
MQTLLVFRQYVAPSLPLSVSLCLSLPLSVSLYLSLAAAYSIPSATERSSGDAVYTESAGPIESVWSGRRTAPDRASSMDKCSGSTDKCSGGWANFSLLWRSDSLHTHRERERQSERARARAGEKHTQRERETDREHGSYEQSNCRQRQGRRGEGPHHGVTALSSSPSVSDCRATSSQLDPTVPRPGWVCCPRVVAASVERSADRFSSALTCRAPVRERRTHTHTHRHR